MLARTARRSIVDLSSSALPPTFLLPFRAHLSTTPQTISTTTDSVPASLLHSKPTSAHDALSAIESRGSHPIQIPNQSPSKPAPRSRLPLHDSIKTMLPLLRGQPSHYITLHIHGKSYLLTAGDILRLPFLMPNVDPGDVLRLNRATHIGSRDFTLKAAATTKATRDTPKVWRYLDERLFTCRATVMGVESEPLRIMEKTKRRQRHVKHVKSKHKYTILRISELTIKDVAALEVENEERALTGETIQGMLSGTEELEELHASEGLPQMVVEENTPQSQGVTEDDIEKLLS